ncbi:MAG: class I SAM-dependent methyltransferase [Gammaproteobacteria bacterium]|nr:class I SAM-dependent methyltransferase [Gammaproteobacteria bacterium]MBU1489367.1 class I SAM-dependent methyltransferase [Gammaproteobacteria bacterium]MBU2065240.1 class I SAM-dependent methyltransferase [Gammaproteobacteria bacterium]MBU2141121.1 class I SAM-dependent methyltransferase [Gammaproteobacteria bacterium]MBU2215344.1 class I SAM-dependent methyltransferase [Gammaproteobacteria bacterium]
MRNEELKALFDQQAAGYDKQWAGMASLRDTLYLLLDALFADLPENARILCVGVGTGAELAHLAERFPGWYFTAVDPSGAMLDICRQRATKGGFLSRCSFHHGYLDTLPAEPSHDGATCFLVSHFLLEPQARIALFHEIARRLEVGGVLANVDLASDVQSPAYEVLLRSWMTLMSSASVPPDVLERARAAYASDVAILPPQQVADLIKEAGFEAPVQFFQAGLMHGWFGARKADINLGK